MFRNKGALQMGCFLGRHLHCLLPLNIRGPVRERGTIDLSSRRSTLSQDFSKPPHFVRLSVCASSACLPAPPAFPLTPSLLSPFLCRLEDAQPRKMCDPAAGGHGREGEEPVSPLT